MYEVMIVEDDPMVAMINKQYVTENKHFHVLCVCRDGDRALKMLRENTVHLVILDVYMPKTNGLELLRKIRELPQKAEYINKNNQRIFMCHAGTNPGMEDEKDWGYKDAFIWNRDHFYDDWFEGYDDLFIVHGHTPVTSLKYKLNILKENEPIEMFRYADGHKFDIDLGSVITNKTVLLDLDTFEPIYFYNIKPNLYKSYRGHIKIGLIRSILCASVGLTDAYYLWLFKIIFDL